MGTVHDMMNAAGLTSRSKIRTDAKARMTDLLNARPMGELPEVHLRVRPNDAIRGPGGRLCRGVSVTALVVRGESGALTLVDVTATLSRLIAPDRVPERALPLEGTAHEWTMGAMAADGDPDVDTGEAWQAAIHGVRSVILPAVQKALAIEFPRLRFRAVTHEAEHLYIEPIHDGETVDDVDIAVN